MLLNISEVLGRWLQSSEQEFEKRKTLFYVDSALRIVKEETLKNERTERIDAQYDRHSTGAVLLTALSLPH